VVATEVTQARCSKIWSPLLLPRWSPVFATGVTPAPCSKIWSPLLLPQWSPVFATGVTWWIRSVIGRGVLPPQWSPVFATGVTLMVPWRIGVVLAAMEPGLRDRGHRGGRGRPTPGGPCRNGARSSRPGSPPDEVSTPKGGRPPQWSPVFATGVTLTLL